MWGITLIISHGHALYVFHAVRITAKHKRKGGRSGCTHGEICCNQSRKGEVSFSQWRWALGVCSDARERVAVRYCCKCEDIRLMSERKWISCMSQLIMAFLRDEILHNIYPYYSVSINGVFAVRQNVQHERQYPPITNIHSQEKDYQGQSKRDTYATSERSWSRSYSSPPAVVRGCAGSA